AVDGDPPALVVGQVQVEVVDLVAGHLVDVALDLRDGEEVPRDVEHGAPVGQARVVDDRAALDAPRPGRDGRAHDGRGQEFEQGLHAGEQACRLVGLDQDSGGGDR